MSEVRTIKRSAWWYTGAATFGMCAALLAGPTTAVADTGDSRSATSTSRQAESAATDSTSSGSTATPTKQRPARPIASAIRRWAANRTPSTDSAAGASAAAEGSSTAATSTEKAARLGPAFRAAGRQGQFAQNRVLPRVLSAIGNKRGNISSRSRVDAANTDVDANIEVDADTGVDATASDAQQADAPTIARPGRTAPRSTRAAAATAVTPAESERPAPDPSPAEPDVTAAKESTEQRTVTPVAIASSAAEAPRSPGPVAALVLNVLSALGLSPRSPAPEPSPTPVDIDSYLGTWYEQGSVKQFFSIGLVNTTAQYSLNEDGSIRVENSGNYIGPRGPLSRIVGSAVTVDNPDNPENTVLNVGFFGATPSSNPPGNYWILDYSQEEGWAIVSDSRGRTGFILTREQTIPDDQYEELVARAEELGVNGRIRPTRQFPES